MPAATTTDGDLALADAYEAFGPGLTRYVTARTRDAALAEDITQEAFMKLAIECRAGRAPRNARAWLYRVALNQIISGSRRTEVARRRTVPVTLEDVTTPSPEARFLDSERHRAMADLLQTVGPAARTCLVLAAQGHSGHDIARAIGRTDAATRALMCRARSDLRAGLARTYSDVA